MASYVNSSSRILVQVLSVLFMAEKREVSVVAVDVDVPGMKIIAVGIAPAMQP